MSKSIITVQLGNYSNFIGSHYWNLHEFSFENSNNNINNNINYYEGCAINNEVTLTPRVISWDWKENLGARIVDDIYEEIENDGIKNCQSRRAIDSLKVNSFKGKVEVNCGFSEEELRVNKSTEIVCDKGTEYNEWNEYLYSRFHPNSLTKLPKLYRNLNSSNFRSFSQGLELTNNQEYLDRMEDQIRSFVEKCDILQGFQLLCDVNDGFSGVGMNFLNHITDEYKKDIISFPVSFSSNNGIESIFNKIFLFNQMNDTSVFWSPISSNNNNLTPVNFSNVNYNPQSKYQSSAILAVALKSLLLPCFLKNSHTLSDYSSVIGQQNNLASLGISLPVPICEKDTLENALTKLSPNDFYQVLNPFISEFGQVEKLIGSIFGICETRYKSHLQKVNGLYNNCSNIVDIMEHFININLLPKKSGFLNSVDPINLNKPFPKIFSSNIDYVSGELRQSIISGINNVQTYNHCPLSLPVSTVLFSNSNCDFLIPLYDSAKIALKLRKIPSLLMEMEADYLDDAIENFRNFI